MSKAIFVTKCEDIPAGEHWAIIENASIHVPGDERSRTNPGHGYPESTQHFITYVAYTDEETFKVELQSRLAPRPGTQRLVRGIHVAGVYEPQVTTTIVEKK